MKQFNSLCRIAAIGLVVAFGMVSVSQAAEVVWRMATKQPSDSNEGKAFQRFADKVAEFSNGQMEVKVFPNEQLGKTEAVLEQVQAGTVHLYPEGSAYLAKWVDDVKYSSAPFMFESREHWANFMKSDLFQGWLRDIEGKAGVTILGDPAAYMRGPYRVMVTKKPWSSLEEMQHVKLRMHPNQLAADVWTHLGAEVRTLGWTEVYSSIKQGIVEAVNSPIGLVESMKFYEVAPHIIRHNEYPQGIGFIMNAKAYNELPDDLKDAVNRAYEAGGIYSVELSDATLADQLNRMKAKGVTYSEPDLSEFQKSMSEFYRQRESKGELPTGFLDAVEASRPKKS
jgi:TRAP-type C4-dicarboxylate transport system substrate-binding protein